MPMKIGQRVFSYGVQLFEIINATDETYRPLFTIPGHQLFAMRSIGFSHNDQWPAPVLFGCQIAVNCHCYIVFGFQTSHQQIITILLQSEFFQKLRIVILVDISPIRQKLALLAILLFVIVMNAHVVGYQVMTVLHSHPFFPKDELPHPSVEFRTLVFQSVHVRGKHGMSDVLYIKPNVCRYNGGVSRLINDVKPLPFQRITQ